MPVDAGSACPTCWTSAPCTGDQRQGNQRVIPRHTTMMSHFPRWLHPALQLASPGLARGTPCSALGSTFAHQRSGEHCRGFEHSLSTGNSFGRVRGIRNPLSLWWSKGTASWAPCQADPYCHEDALVKNPGSRYSGHKTTPQQEAPMDVTDLYSR